jgi:phosphate:Na+ symporter
MCIRDSFTTTPLTGALTGAATTMVVQSSSATVMTTIGFVGAGLLTFPQAVGVILGANVGTTVTGWMVAVLGLKLKLGTVALPLLFAASLLATLGRGSAARAGTAVAGFSLVFIGLDLMLAGSATVLPLVTALHGAEGGVGTLALFVLAGAAVTAVIQSSSAGVATALVMLAGGGIDLVQAAALVIGMDFGTTLKSLVATLGGSTAMRRTALAHVLYNVIAGVTAFLMLPLVPLLGRLTGGDLPMALVAFHTAFNLTGVLILQPVAGPFARLITRLLPGAQGLMPEPLDRALLASPPAALDAARTTAMALARSLFGHLRGRILGLPGGGELPEGFAAALRDLDDFLLDIAIDPGAGGMRARYSALLHLVDHLNRLWHRAGQTDRLPALRADPALRRPARALAAALDRAARADAGAPLADRLGRLHGLIRGRTARLRRSVLLREHVGLVEPREVFAITDALRWLERVTHHAERITRYGVTASYRPGRAPGDAPERADPRAPGA